MEAWVGTDATLKDALSVMLLHDPGFAARGDAPLHRAGRRREVKRAGWRVALTPILLVAATAAILWWVNHGRLQPGESAVLSTANLRARAWEHVQMSAV